MRIIFGLGSNLGNREFYLKLAIEKLTQQLNLKDLKLSQIFPNPAMLAPNAPKEWDLEFLNLSFSADVEIAKFEPEKILEIVKKIEAEIGRQNREKWAPREIDIDILAIEHLQINLEDRLIIPHYDILNRDFFLKTIAEIEPEFLEELILNSARSFKI